MKSESEIQQLIQLEAPKMGVTLLRNNSGAFKDETGRLVRYGLGQISNTQPYKSSDLIGWTEVIVTEQMIGQRIAIFTAVEVKKEGWKAGKDEREEKQNNFIRWIKSRGGIAG
ncbi:MAG: hypothetical protein E6R04_05410, partial [Spirochaetes bacterium]